MIKNLIKEADKVKYYWKKNIPPILFLIILGSYTSKYAIENPLLITITILFFSLAIGLSIFLVKKEMKLFHLVDKAIIASNKNTKNILKGMRRYIAGDIILTVVFPLFVTISLICKILFIGKLKDLRSSIY